MSRQNTTVVAYQTSCARIDEHDMTGVQSPKAQRRPDSMCMFAAIVLTTLAESMYCNNVVVRQEAVILT